MRILQTDKPLWLGREHTRWPVLWFIAAHRVGQYNPIQPHRLPCWEIGLVQTGRLDLLLDGQAVDVPAEHLVVIPPDTQICSDEGMNAGLFFWLGLRPQAEGALRTPALAAELDDLTRRLEAHRLTVAAAGEALLPAAAAALETIADRGATEMRRLAASMGLVAEVSRALHGQAAADAQAEHDVQAAMDLVRTRLASPPTTGEMARACGLSRATFNKAFRAATGLTPRAWLNARRVEEACRLLESGDLSVTDVAMALGFSSSQYFASVFRRHTGRRPSSIRRGPGDV